MSSNKIIRGPYFNDLIAQPAAVRDTLLALSSSSNEKLEACMAKSFERIILTGMGSSLAALHPLALRLIARGLNVISVDASELIHSMKRLLTPETLVVAVSQSGRSAEIVRLASREGSGGQARAFTLVGVTNTTGSPLANAADAVILTRAGEESTVSCKTYVATLAALVFLGDVMSGGSELATLQDAPAAIEAYLAMLDSHLAELEPLTQGVRDIFFAGRGTSVAAAQTAGLIVKESTRMHAEGMTSAALRHGPMEMAADHVLALVYEGDDDTAATLNATLVRDLARAGARAYLVGRSAEVKADVFRLIATAPPAMRPLLEILPAQMLSLALASHAGIEAGRFLHATKVTATE